MPPLQGITHAEFSYEMNAMRSLITERFDKLDSKLEAHEAADNLVATRVAIIETQRTEEGNQKDLAATVLNRRATFKASLIAVAITVGARVLELIAWHKP